MSANGKIGPRFVTFLFALLASAFMVATYVVAQPATAQTSTEKIKVVGHIDLKGIHAKQIYLRNRDDRNYLFIQRPHKHAFAIVDVTNPAKPLIIDRAALQTSAGGTVALPAQGSVLAIAVAPEHPSASSEPDVPLPTESIRLVDMSDPAHPQTLKTFDGVTAMVSDDGRKLVYIVNGEGLWIISHHQARSLPLCTSSSEEAPEPSCQ
jgi:hypothetical protein